MKAMSKFFLMISAVIAALGIILMIVGAISASSADVQLYPEKINGKYVFTVDMSDKEISTIKIDATDTDIDVITGEESEYIEFINFNQNKSSISTTNSMVKFEENASLTSVLSFWNGNFEFKGLRSIFSFGGEDENAKQIVIHLKSTEKIKNFSFTIGNGDISIANAKSDTDYIITMDSGNIDFKAVKTNSNVSINGNDCKVNFEDCRFKYFDADITTVEIYADVHGIHDFEYTSLHGKMNAILALDSADNDIRITNNIPFTLNDDEYPNSYSNSDKMGDAPEEYAKIHINGDDLILHTKITAPSPKTEETEN